MREENAVIVPGVQKVKQSRRERAYYKKRRLETRSMQQDGGCDHGGRPGGSIGSRRKEPAGWKQRRGCKCALHYGGFCRDFIRNATDVPRRRRKLRPHIPVKYSRCLRCNTIGHLARDCYMSRDEAQRTRSRVVYSQKDGSMMITAYKKWVKEENADNNEFSEGENRLVIDESQQENRDEDADIGSPPTVEIAANEDLDEDNFEIRSEAEISEDAIDLNFSSSDEEDERSQTTTQPQMRQPRTQPMYIVPQIRMPSPEVMLVQMKQGEESLRRALLERADQKRRQNAVISAENADNRHRQLIAAARANNENVIKRINADNQPSTSGYRVTRSQSSQEDAVKKTQMKYGIDHIKKMLERVESKKPVVVCEVLSDAAGDFVYRK